MFFRIQIFQGPGPGSGSRFRVQALEVAVEFDVIFINFITFAQSLFGHVICVFILTYEKQFVKVIKISVQFLIKNMPLESF